MSKMIDLTGQRFGQLVVIKCEGRNKRREAIWQCKCHCGRSTVVPGYDLRSGHTSSCGYCGIGKRFIDLTGQKFGRLTVIERIESEEGNKNTWLCKCDCGQYTIVLGSNLRKGNTSSCGCFFKETLKKRSTRHGNSKSKLYKVWSEMKRRCNNPNDTNFSNYGSRGIKVCKEWSDDFSAFQKWALANGYKEGLTIDRMDNNMGYFPENCRWTNNKEQANNKRTSRYVTYQGETKTVAEWAEIIGIPYHRLIYRLNNGWSVERAFESK